MRWIRLGAVFLLSCGAAVPTTARRAPDAETKRPPPPLAFSIQDGTTDNRFLRDGKVAAHVLATSGASPRIVVAFPAGNMGIGLWFDGPSELAIRGELASVERPGGLRGITTTLHLARGLRVKTALLGSVRALRNYGHDGRTPPELENQIIEGRPLTIRRTTVDGAHHLALSLEPAAMTGGSITLTDDTVKLEALSDEEPLTPLATEAILTSAASDDKRARDALSFLSYEQKILAGSWQYLTYFGRDTLLSTLLLLPVLKPAVIEAALGAVLDRLAPDGDVAHEEDIGEWAALENLQRSPRPENLRQPIYDYKMVDDDFMLAPVVAAYFDTEEGKRRAAAFLGRAANGRTYAEGLRRNLERVLERATPFAATPSFENLIHLGKGLPVGNWRDSNEGLGTGQIPYDVNAALVPAALRAAERIYALPAFGADEARSAHARELARAWSKAESLFTVKIEAAEARKRLATYGAEEKLDVREAVATITSPVTFPALALDAKGRPIPVVHSDESFVMMFGEPSSEWLVGAADRITNFFPAGLRTPVGIVVANPAFVTDAAIRKLFTRDHYHGTVVWSWQQAFLLAGVRRQLARPSLSSEARSALGRAEAALATVIAATRAHRTSELWSFSVDPQGYHVVPFGQSAGHHSEANAVQLWSTVYLALD